MAIPVNQIGTQAFIDIVGEVQADGIIVQDITRPFVDGVGFRRIARRGKPSTLRCVVDLPAPIGLADNFKESYLALQGTVVSIIQRDVVRGNYLILSAFVDDIRRVETPVGGLIAGNFFTTVTFVVIFAGL